MEYEKEKNEVCSLLELRIKWMCEPFYDCALLMSAVFLP